MASLNKAMLIGRLGADVELRYSQSNTAIANFSIATNERYKEGEEWKERTEWHRVVTFGHNAEFLQKYSHKGSMIYVEGSLQTRQWEDKDGNTKYTTEVKAFSVQVLSDSREPASEPAKQTAPVVDTNDFDDDLPF